MRTPRSLGLEPVTVLDLFSGCGGFTQGFHEFRPEGSPKEAGPCFRSVAAVEHDTSAAATYAVNFGTGRRHKNIPAARVHLGNIEDWTPTADERDADVVVGGPPCQGFSALNRNKKGAERNRLWEEYVRVVEEIKPKIFVIENVDRFLKSDEFQNLLKEVGTGGAWPNIDWLTRLATFHPTRWNARSSGTSSMQPTTKLCRPDDAPSSSV